MSKAKQTIQEFREKLFEKKKEEIVEQSNKIIQENLEYVAYDVVQDPSTKSRSYVMVKIRYDLNTRQAVVEEVRPFEDKAAGLTIQMDKENRKYLFERNRSKK